jgi:hypothetical protein
MISIEESMGDVDSADFDEVDIKLGFSQHADVVDCPGIVASLVSGARRDISAAGGGVAGVACGGGNLTRNRGGRA